MPLTDQSVRQDYIYFLWNHKLSRLQVQQLPAQSSDQPEIQTAYWIKCCFLLDNYRVCYTLAFLELLKSIERERFIVC